MGVVAGYIGSRGALVMYVVSRSVALPDFEQAVGRWFGPLGVISLVVEALFVAVFPSEVNCQTWLDKLHSTFAGENNYAL